jgi:hypothetical protein
MKTLERKVVEVGSWNPIKPNGRNSQKENMKRNATSRSEARV